MILQKFNNLLLHSIFIKNKEKIYNNLIMSLVEEKIINIYKYYKKYNKKIIIFLKNYYNNIYNNIYSKLENKIIIYRTSIKKSLKLKNEYLLPSSYKINYINNIFLEKTEKPKIGFCGYIGVSPHRLKIIKKLKNNNNYIVNIILREKWGGLEISDEKRKLEYFRNIDDNHFTLCFNGAGNFSFRFYEVLARGRIPILLNTDNILPFEEEIDYSKHIVVSDNLDDIPNKIINFYNKMDIIEIQKNNKILFDKYFRNENLTTKLITYLD